jgi:hypothetical protein
MPPDPVAALSFRGSSLLREPSQEPPPMRPSSRPVTRYSPRPASCASALGRHLFFRQLQRGAGSGRAQSGLGPGRRDRSDPAGTEQVRLLSEFRAGGDRLKSACSGVGAGTTARTRSPPSPILMGASRWERRSMAPAGDGRRPDRPRWGYQRSVTRSPQLSRRGRPRHPDRRRPAQLPPGEHHRNLLRPT